MENRLSNRAEWRYTLGGRSIVPDVVVFAWERIPLDDSGEVAKLAATDTKADANAKVATRYNAKKNADAAERPATADTNIAIALLCWV